MSYQSYCPRYDYTSYPYHLPWWQDTRYDDSRYDNSRYDDYCYRPPRQTLRRCYSFDSSSAPTYNPPKPRRDDPVKIYLNLRYKYTTNCDTLLCDQLCVEISPHCRVIDVWRAAKKCYPHLRHFQATEKVLSTDSHQRCFTEICSQARIKDEFHKSQRNWVFVVYPPYNSGLNGDKYKKEKKPKKPNKDKKYRNKSPKKRPSKTSCSCACY